MLYLYWKELTTYWAKAECFEPFARLYYRQDANQGIIQVAQNGTVNIDISIPLSTDTILVLKRIIDCPLSNVSENVFQLVFHFLFELGCLSKKDKITNGNERKLIVELPNLEIKREFSYILCDSMIHHYNI